MRRLLALTITKDDTTSFYRAAGVMRDIVRQIPDLIVDIHDVSKIGKMTWSLLSQYDAVFLQRPYMLTELFTYLKEMNIPIWVDYDDNLFQVPDANHRAFDLFMDEKIQKNLVEIAKKADVITVSTQALKTMYETACKDVRVIPNCLPVEFIGSEAQLGKRKSMLWRGGDSHRLDIDVYEYEIGEAMDKYKEWDFAFAGFNPYRIMKPNKKYRKPEDVILYMKWIREYNPIGMWVPLLDNYFNRCKSNIAALEGTFAGAVCLVPDWEEWQIPGTLKYKTPEEFGEKAQMILNGQVNAKKYRAMALEYIRDNYDLNRVNKLRVELVKELLEW